MKKLSMLLLFTVSAIVVCAQSVASEQEWRRQYYSYGCNGTETLKQCKIRNRRENIEKQRYEDSVKREGEASYNAWRREIWEKERVRRETLTPEERAREDEERRLAFEEDKKKKIYGNFEVEAGVNYADKSGTEPAYSPVLGALLGVRTKLVNLTDEISLGIGATYSMQGGKYESSEYVPGGNYTSSSSTSRLNNLNFPIFVRYQRDGREGFFAEAGVQPGLLLSAKNKGATTTDIKSELQKVDVGIPIGAGYKFKNKFSVGLRITPGLMNVNKDKEYKNKNMVASLRASYSL